MPWNKQDYPVSMKNLKPRVRHKAIEIANALLDEGYEEGRSIAIATAKAEEWDENHPTPESSKSDSTSSSEHAEPKSHLPRAVVIPSLFLRPRVMITSMSCLQTPVGRSRKKESLPICPHLILRQKL